MKLNYDNKSAIYIFYNLVKHDKTKHIEGDKHFIKKNLKVAIFPSLLKDILHSYSPRG